MKSIRRALTFRLSVAAFSLALIAGVALYAYLRSALLREFDVAIAAKARTVGSQVKRESDGRLEFELAPQAMPEFQRTRNPEYYQIWLADGTLVAKSNSLRDGSLPSASVADGSAKAWNMPLPDGRAGRAMTIRLAAQDETDESVDDKNKAALRIERGAIVTVTFATTRARLDKTLDILLSSLIVAAGVLSIGTALVQTWTISWGLRPLRQLAEQTSQIDASSLHQRFAVSDMPQELRPICDRLNDLLGRLQEAFLRERRFTADVGHELRTPIAELRTLAEVSLKWPEDTGPIPQRWRETLEIARQMESVVNTLLSLTRCEYGRQGLSLESVSLPEMVRRAWEPFSECIDRKGISIGLGVIPEATILTDKTLLASILRNVFSNAADYTPAGGCIACSAELNENAVTLEIGNTTDFLEAADLAHVYEPFWRKNPARNDSAHSGLGLSLVAAYSRLIGIELSVNLKGPNWFLMRLTAPYRPQDNAAGTINALRPEVRDGYRAAVVQAASSERTSQRRGEAR
jgi:two-component system sensor histidine kinase QseC